MRPWLCVLVLGFAACNTASDEPDASWCVDCDQFRFDAPTPVLSPALPGGQQGCGVSGQKATWIVVQELPDRLGKLGCVPDGIVPAGSACVFGSAGETTGFDNCVAGLVCSEGSCADICSLSASSPPATRCATGTCTVDPLLFANGADPPAFGVCR